MRDFCQKRFSRFAFLVEEYSLPEAASAIPGTPSEDTNGTSSSILQEVSLRMRRGREEICDRM